MIRKDERYPLIIIFHPRVPSLFDTIICGLICKFTVPVSDSQALFLADEVEISVEYDPEHLVNVECTFSVDDLRNYLIVGKRHRPWKICRNSYLYACAVNFQQKRKLNTLKKIRSV